MEPVSDKKRAIFDSMLELVRENGFHGCPMSTLAKSAGVAAGTIYHYFESKEQLIRELYVVTTGRMIEAMYEGINDTLPYKDSFFKLWMNLYRYYIANPNDLFFFEQFVHSPYNTYRHEEGHDAFHEKLFQFTEKGVEQGYFRSMDSGISGILVHSNIRTAARIKQFGKIRIGEEELGQIRQILWDGMTVR